ncbi:MAG: asparagine synthase (glutamine-hydrolyzing) [Solirubrobacterales bacterium]|nr:asparagine synthase (glutamine-hydrolyzing) [Solirubrobacterales bacterium]MBV9472723.1 asparagine synthase (glutamine-hydrolyzing) [Solirubrobacterales bacterium]
MCGIAGSVGPAARADAVEDQLATVRHRGADAQGCFRSGHARLGQTRLAVIDLRTGDPPLTDEDGTRCAVLNGELYNFRELRRRLEAGGHRLRSQGDTEVLAHLAEELDAVELAQAVDGMFAFAIWDGRRQRLLLGRDRAGKKPLYWWHSGERLVFGSEIKAVLADPSVPRALNRRAIPAYLTFGYVPTPETFYEGVLSLPPGHVLTYSPGSQPVIERYWHLPLARPERRQPDSFPEATARVRSLLEAAVERRLISDVPLGAFLSGGVDSSAIVALMSRLSGERVRTFTIGFEDRNGLDERPFARLVARRYGTEHHEHVVRTRAVELVETLLWHHDQPFGDSSALPTYLLSEVTRRDVTVALSGDGGDELFAGYERFAAALALERYRRVPAPARELARVGLGRLNPQRLSRRVESAQRFTARGALPTLDAYRSWLSFLPEEERSRALERPDDWALRKYAALWRSSQGADTLARLLELNFSTYLLDDLLVKADRMSMAHGLEVRSPFLDTGLTELAFSLPSEFKLRGLRRKRILAAAVADLVPREVVRRRKRGFAVPLDSWFRGELSSLLADRLGAADARVRKHLRGELLDAIIAQHAGGRRNRGQTLWMLLMLELFLRREGW